MQTPIYFDNNSTTIPDSRVIKAIVEALEAVDEGNPSSQHSFGQRARQRLQLARAQIASCLEVRPDEVIFTSGGTEGMTMLLRGIIQARRHGHLVTSNVEHSCLYAPIAAMEKEGLSCTYLDVGKWGAPTPDAVSAAIRSDTRLIALMAVNNETGVKTDIAAIANIAAEANIPFVVDGVALMGKELFKIPPGVTAMAFSGHKFHAPKGVGFVVIRSFTKLMPLFIGGEQEFGRRAGTENLPGIVGLAAAMQLLQSELPEASRRMQAFKDYFENELQARLEGVTINGCGPRIVNTSNLAFKDVEGETLLTALDLAGIAVSHGSACASGALEPSRVLLNMGYPKEIARSSVRFSISRMTTQADIDACIEAVVTIVNRLR